MIQGALEDANKMPTSLDLEKLRKLAIDASTNGDKEEYNVKK